MQDYIPEETTGNKKSQGQIINASTPAEKAELPDAPLRQTIDRTKTQDNENGGDSVEMSIEAAHLGLKQSRLNVNDVESKMNINEDEGAQQDNGDNFDEDEAEKEAEPEDDHRSQEDKSQDEEANDDGDQQDEEQEL